MSCDPDIPLEVLRSVKRFAGRIVSDVTLYKDALLQLFPKLTEDDYKKAREYLLEKGLIKSLSPNYPSIIQITDEGNSFLDKYVESIIENE